MLASTSQPPPSSQPSLPITCRTKLLDVVSEEVLPSDRLKRPFLLLYLPWRGQEGTRVESERTFPNPQPTSSRATAKSWEYCSLICTAPPPLPCIFSWRWYSPRGEKVSHPTERAQTTVTPREQCKEPGGTHRTPYQPRDWGRKGLKSGRLIRQQS